MHSLPPKTTFYRRENRAENAARRKNPPIYADTDDYAMAAVRALYTLSCNGVAIPSARPLSTIISG